MGHLRTTPPGLDVQKYSGSGGQEDNWAVDPPSVVKSSLPCRLSLGLSLFFGLAQLQLGSLARNPLGQLFHRRFRVCARKNDLLQSGSPLRGRLDEIRLWRELDARVGNGLLEGIGI